MRAIGAIVSIFVLAATALAQGDRGAEVEAMLARSPFSACFDAPTGAITTYHNVGAGSVVGLNGQHFGNLHDPFARVGAGIVRAQRLGTDCHITAVLEIQAQPHNCVFLSIATLLEGDRPRGFANPRTVQAGETIRITFETVLGSSNSLGPSVYFDVHLAPTTVDCR